MKLDYNFIKQILLVMEECDSHEIECHKLMQTIGVMDTKSVISKDLKEKFIGHIKILGDKYFIESSDTKGNYGFAKGAQLKYHLKELEDENFDFIIIESGENI